MLSPLLFFFFTLADTADIFGNILNGISPDIVNGVVELTEKTAALNEFFKNAWLDGVDSFAVGEKTGYSIGSGIVDEKTGKVFDNVVVLDTDIFEGVPPRNWNKVLDSWIKKRINDTGTFIATVEDENGNIKNVEFADPKDKITKNGKRRTILNPNFRHLRK